VHPGCHIPILPALASGVSMLPSPMPPAVGLYLAQIVHLLTHDHRLMCGSFAVVALILHLLQFQCGQLKELGCGQNLTSGGFPTGCIIFCHAHTGQQLICPSPKANSSAFYPRSTACLYLPPPKGLLTPHSRNKSTHLDKFRPHDFLRLAHANSHIAQQRRMTNVRSVAVAGNVRGPFEFRDIGMPRSDITRLKLLELLGCAKFVCLRWMLDGGFTGLEKKPGALGLGKDWGCDSNKIRQANAYHSYCEFEAELSETEKLSLRRRDVLPILKALHQP